MANTNNVKDNEKILKKQDSSFEFSHKKRKIKILSICFDLFTDCVVGAGYGIIVALSEGKNAETILPSEFLSIKNKKADGFNQLKQINGQTFRYFLAQHDKIDTVIFPSECEEIKEEAYKNAPDNIDNSLPSAIKKIDFKGENVSIDNRSFDSTMVEKVELLNVSKIGDNAFSNCELSNTLYFGEHTMELGENSFSANANITTLDFSHSSASDISIGSNCFAQCPNIKKLYCSGPNDYSF
jgi:hypothetical protein